jgi:hypothetical protein
LNIKNEQRNIIRYHKSKPGQLECILCLSKLFPTYRERNDFNIKWQHFIDSDPDNRDIYHIDGDHLIYLTEQLIPSETDVRPPLLLILGNPASHSVKAGMFFAFEGNNRREHRFWKHILYSAGVLDLGIDADLPVGEQNNLRRERMLGLEYDSPFRLGLCVYISMPSAASGHWSGIAGILKLLGSRAMKQLEAAEKCRVLEYARVFLNPDGIAVVFQKYAWEGLRSAEDQLYGLDSAKNGDLVGTLRNMPEVPLLGVPPTRLVSHARKILRKLLLEQGYALSASRPQNASPKATNLA